MRKINYVLDIGYSGCHDEGTEYVTDDMSNEDIDSMVDEMAMDWAQSWEGDSRLGFDPDASEEEQEEEIERFYENVGGSWEFVEDEND